jgi:hypothetical protein
MSDQLVESADITIVAARYRGVYEGGRWLAFPLDPRKLPQDWQSNDIACVTFFSHYAKPLGKGSSPDGAYADLIEQWSCPSRDEQLALTRAQWDDA